MPCSRPFCAPLPGSHRRTTLSAPALAMRAPALRTRATSGSPPAAALRCKPPPALGTHAACTETGAGLRDYDMQNLCIAHGWPDQDLCAASAQEKVDLCSCRSTFRRPDAVLSWVHAHSCRCRIPPGSPLSGHCSHDGGQHLPCSGASGRAGLGRATLPILAGAPVEGKRVAAVLVRAGQRARGDVRHHKLDGPRRDGAATWRWPASALIQAPQSAGVVWG